MPPQAKYIDPIIVHVKKGSKWLSSKDDDVYEIVKIEEGGDYVKIRNKDGEETTRRKIFLSFR